MAPNLEMVKIDDIRASNAKGKTLEGLVTVFVGGTGAHSGRAQRRSCSCARRGHVRTLLGGQYVAKPHPLPALNYLDRSEERGNKVIRELKERNPGRRSNLHSERHQPASECRRAMQGTQTARIKDTLSVPDGPDI